MSTATANVKMTAEAKKWLSDTVRDLRQNLLKDLADAVESTYRLSIPAERAGLDEEKSRKRARLEEWLSEQVRGGLRGAKETEPQARERHLKTAVKMASATFLNRLLVLRQMEALGLMRVKTVTGGLWVPNTAWRAATYLLSAHSHTMWTAESSRPHPVGQAGVRGG